MIHDGLHVAFVVLQLPDHPFLREPVYQLILLFLDPHLDGGTARRLQPHETRLWAEIQAVWDPWIWLVVAGTAALLGSGSLRLVARRGGRSRRS